MEIKMIISLRLNDDDSMLIKKYAELNNISVSEFLRQSAIERIEEEYDISLFGKALEEFRKNPVTYTLDEVERDLGLK